MPWTDQEYADRGESSPDPAQSSEICVAELSDPEELDIYSLVLSAADITHRIRILENGSIEIYVAPAMQEKALYEMSAYAHENTAPAEPHERESVYTPTFRAMGPLLIGGLALMYGVTGDWQPESYWFVKGAGDSTAILKDSEFYRLVTPLTLHADIAHLLSNGILGVFLLHFFLHLTGNGIGLTALLLTAATANFINVSVHGPGHLFVGFSTATFSIIGMLCTIRFVGRSSRFGLHFLMPIMAGLALLAFLGSSGERTDLGGHLFGLLCGLLAGNLVRLPFFDTLRNSFALQTLLGIAVLSVVWGCWLAALSR
jgi:membrane associated rhomboid family serine protease